MMAKKEQIFLKSIKHGGACSFYRRAFELGVKVEELKDSEKAIKISYGKKFYYMRRQTIPTAKKMGILTRDKKLTKAILSDAGIYTPKGVEVTDIRQSDKVLSNTNIKYPFVVKPKNGSRASGVTWNVQNEAELLNAIKFAFKNTKGSVLIEEMFKGEEFRVLVFKDKVLSALHKIPAGVIGDGVSSIFELIEDFNKERRVGFSIILDKTAKKTLKKSGYTLKTILPKGIFFPFRHSLLMAQGGRAINKTFKLNKKYKDACVNAVFVLGLQFGGVDIIVKDINKPSDYAILEVNANPFYNMHEKELVEGKPVDVSGLILADLFPALKKKIGKA